MIRPRVGIVGLVQESNGYSPRATTLADFDERLGVGEGLARLHRGTESVIGGFLDARDLELVPLFGAMAWPAAAAPREVAEALLGGIREALVDAPPLDGVLLDLHGAMIADGHPDMEADVAALVRERVGRAPIAVVLDLHANPSPRFVELIDIAVAYRTYPHVDARACGREAAGLLAEQLRGRALNTRIAKLPLLTTPLAQATAEEPMRGLLDRAERRARELGVARVSLTPGFPYVDVPRAGFSVLAVADAAAASAATRLLEEVRRDVTDCAPLFRVDALPPHEAVRRAATSSERPVVLIDLADNVGGGAAGDGTALLSELLAQGVEGAIVTLADASVAAEAAAAGVGAVLETSVGARLDDRHGQPVKIHARIEAVGDGSYRSGGPHLRGHTLSMGTTAVLRVNGLRLVVTERAVPPFHVEQLTSLGLDPRTATVITAKGAVAWRTAFGSIAGDVIAVDTPGACPVDPHTLPRQNPPMEI